jgi:predicted  nucleic acid-binding Zn-ribbon protein
MEKESLERNLREMTKNYKEASDELELVRHKLTAIEKKMAKFEESRTEEFHKFNARINELDKVREALDMENEMLKSSIAKK